MQNILKIITCDFALDQQILICQNNILLTFCQGWTKCVFDFKFKGRDSLISISSPEQS